MYVGGARRHLAAVRGREDGRIRVIENGALLTTPFLDISSRVSTGGEQGLLSMGV